MKKALSLCLVFALLLVLFGCGKKDSETQTEKKAAAFYRLSSVTIKQNGKEPQTYAVTWSENGCTFTTTEIRLGPCVTEASFDTQTKTFFLHQEGEDVGVRCVFDDMGRTIRFENPATPQSSIDISYDEQGWPQVEEGKLRDLKIDKDKMQYSFIHTYGFSGDSTGKTYTTEYTYWIVTLDKAGRNTKVDRRVVKEYKDDGRIEETVQENFADYTYDAGGNLLRYEDDDTCVEFAYSPEEIHHNWERLIPMLCYDSDLIWVEPLFWKLK